MSPRQPFRCEGLAKWLTLNGLSLGSLTGTDWRALDAAAHIIELYAVSGDEEALTAFRSVVLCMQPTTREFAFHAIAQCLDWSDREVIWHRAGLPPLAAWTRCKGER